jgi:hypothetical protein
MDNDEKMMQKIIEILIEIKAPAADRKADKEELMAKLDSNQKKAEADRNADKEERKAYKEKMASDRIANQEKMAANKEDFLARMKEEDRQANQDFLARMEAIFDDNRKKAESDKENFWAKMDAIHEKRMAMLRYPSETDENLFWTDEGRQRETKTKEH